ncbi:hypothetical protein ACHAXM_006265 [Skeletonema potamos]|jgi:hypothetical protein
MIRSEEESTPPMSVATEPPSSQSKKNVGSDVVATRHLRHILESITSDKNLSEEERKRKISDFGAALMANAETKPEIQTRTFAPPVYSPQVKDEIVKMELVKAVLLANAEKSKKSPPSNEREEPQTTATTLIQPKPETKTMTATVSKPEIQTHTAAASITSSSSQSNKPELKTTSLSQQKSSKKKKKGWLLRIIGKKNRDEVRGDCDERDCSQRNPERDPAEVHSFSEVGSNEVGDEKEAYDNANMGTGSNMSAQSEDSDRSIGTFEQDYIESIMRDQINENHLQDFEDVLSECTFEQDARALSPVSTGTFEQDAKALEKEHTAVVVVPQEIGGNSSNLSETTFEQDAVRDDYRNDELIGADSDLSDASYNSETTFERDMRTKPVRRTANTTSQQIFVAPSLESVTTFEKEARGREAVASRSRSFGPQIDDCTSEEEQADSDDCSDTFMQDISQDMRPAQPAPQPVRETTAAPDPMPKISELQVELSPVNIAKAAGGRSFFSKFSCNFA